MDLGAQIIGVLHDDPMTREKVHAQFPEEPKGEVNFAIEDLLDDGFIVLEPEKQQYQITNKAKKQYNLA